MCFAQVLQSFKIMDYSLLLAIHKVEETTSTTSGTATARYKRSFSEPATDKPATRAETPSGHLPSPSDDVKLMSPGNGQWDTRADSPGKHYMTYMSCEETWNIQIICGVPVVYLWCTSC